MASGQAKADELWRSLRLLPSSATAAAANSAAMDDMVRGLEQFELAVGARWSWDQGAIDEGDEPFGETLLHACAAAGQLGLADALLANGARADTLGAVSGCTALHAAAAAGHTAVCLRLIERGAPVGALSAAGKRTALHLACARGHVATARALVEVGGADPYLCASSGGGESLMGLLRRMGTAPALGLLAELDRLCGARSMVAAEGATAESGNAAARAVVSPKEHKKSKAHGGAASSPVEAEADELADDEHRYEEGFESDDEGDGGGLGDDSD